MKSIKKHKTKKLTVTFSERDVMSLQHYAEGNGVSKAVAIRRIVKQYLHDYENRIACDEVAKNQIGLFDSMQADIFGNLTKL